jgi:hypothetical protein
MGFGRISSSPRVKSGNQYRSERSVPAPPDHNVPRGQPEIYRKHPGQGCCHVLMNRDIRRFVSILPDWGNLSIGLNAIIPAPARPNCDGYHRSGLVAICAQSRLFSHLVPEQYAQAHRDVFERLGVPIERAACGYVLNYTRSTLRAFQLLHIFLHELGHHHDRMATGSRRRASRGERYAEIFARTNGDFIGDEYFKAFPPE